MRLLNVVAKEGEEILKLFKKDFVYIGLSKKKSIYLQDNLDGYNKVVNYSRFFLLICTISSSAY